jgi:hypothetical protein
VIVFFLPIICQKESINLTVNFKKTFLASELEETEMKQNILYESFHVCSGQRNYDLEAHINSAIPAHAHANPNLS